MEGISIGRESDFIKNARKKSTEVRLLARGNGFEVMKQFIAPDSRITLTCEPDWDGFEFYFILDGVLVCEDERGEMGRLSAGDYISVTRLCDDVYFRTETGVTLLYFSSQPIFHVLSEEIQHLVDLAKEVERKDNSTEQHCERLQHLSMQVGETMGLSPKRLELLIYAAFLHDIGKVGVCDSILNKKEPLTSDEWKEIAKHPVVGRQILEKTFLKDAGPIVEQHHEWFNGAGYPYGLKGDDILLEARIIAVVDAFDAMTSDRPYRPAMTRQAALEELQRCAGKQFDPAIVKAFMEVLHSCQA